MQRGIRLRSPETHSSNRHVRTRLSAVYALTASASPACAPKADWANQEKEAEGGRQQQEAWLIDAARGRQRPLLQGHCTAAQEDDTPAAFLAPHQFRGTEGTTQRLPEAAAAAAAAAATAAAASEDRGATRASDPPLQ
ncbi:hypothetical protein Efla_007010 [Eimeria flavescens]